MHRIYELDIALGTGMTQAPLIFILKMGDVLYRHHQSALDPIYFGTSGTNRFDAPD